MSPTPRTLWVFRATVAIGLVASVYFARAGQRHFLWATLGAQLLAIFALQAFGQVALRDAGSTQPDHLSRAMEGPRGIWVRAGLVLLVVLLVLLGAGALEPSVLADGFLSLANMVFQETRPK